MAVVAAPQHFEVWLVSLNPTQGSELTVDKMRLAKKLEEVTAAEAQAVCDKLVELFSH